MSKQDSRAISLLMMSSNYSCDDACRKPLPKTHTFQESSTGEESFQDVCDLTESDKLH